MVGKIQGTDLTHGGIKGNHPSQVQAGPFKKSFADEGGVNQGWRRPLSHNGFGVILEGQNRCHGSMVLGQLEGLFDDFLMPQVKAVKHTDGADHGTPKRG